MRTIEWTTISRKIILWSISSISLLIVYFIGYLISFLNNIIIILLGTIFIPGLLFLNLLIFLYYEKLITLKKSKRISIWLILSVNLLFAFVIGLNIPLMETKNSQNMGYIMIPLLIALNYVLIDRLHYHLKHVNEKKDIPLEENNLKERKRPVIEYEGRKYQFSISSLILLAIGAPLLAYIIYIVFDNVANYWLHEIVVKQTVFFLRTFFNIDVRAEYSPVGKFHWRFDFATIGDINFETFCTGVQAICVFAGIIVFTPHSKDPNTREDIVWRKTKSLIVSSIAFYVVNIIRMLIQLGLYTMGYPWESIHYSISAASSFVAAIIVLLLHKWIPEFIISFIYTGTLISEPIKARRKEQLLKELNSTNKINLELVRKVIGMKKKDFKIKFPVMIKKLEFKIEKNYLIVPNKRESEFLEAIDNKFRSKE